MSREQLLELEEKFTGTGIPYETGASAYVAGWN